MATPVLPARRRPRRLWLRLGVLALVLVLLALALTWRAATRVDEAERAQLFPSPAASTAGGVTPMPRPTKPAEAGDAMNIVVIRTAGEGEPPGAVALVHVDDARSRVDVVTFPPSIVPPGSSDSLADIYLREGTPGVIGSVEQLTQVPADHAAELNAAGFDALTSLMSAGNLANPVATDKAVTTVMENMTVDENFTTEKMRDLAMDLVTTGKPYTHVLGDSGDSSVSRDQLTTALRTDDLASL